MRDFAVGQYITNGSSAGKVMSVDAKGVKIANVGMERFGGNVGMTQVIPLTTASGWREVPFEWAPVLGAPSLRQRYVWEGSRLVREVRPVSPCRSGCATKDHDSYADCLKAAAIQIGNLK